MPSKKNRKPLKEISNKIDKSYVSELDQFIQAFDQANPTKSASQLADIKKDARIAQLRDHAIAPDAAGPKVWEAFLNDSSSTS
jgi:hypothetical protein